MDNKTKCCCSNEPADLTDKQMVELVEGVLDDYKDKPGGLIPMLQIAQNMFGYLPDAVLKQISVAFDKPYSEVAGIVSFYSFFSTVPRGKNLVRVCLGTACYVRGGKEVLQSLKKALQIDVGETTEDKNFSLDVGRCFGACGLAPVIMINDDVHQRVKPAKISELLAPYAEAPEEAKEPTEKVES